MEPDGVPPPAEVAAAAQPDGHTRTARRRCEAAPTLANAALAVAPASACPFGAMRARPEPIGAPWARRRPTAADAGGGGGGGRASSCCAPPDGLQEREQQQQRVEAVQRPMNGKSLGNFVTAEEAALAVARHLGPEGIAKMKAAGRWRLAHAAQGR